MLRTIESSLAVPAKYAEFADPILRGSLSLIFIIGGLGHFFAHPDMLARMDASP